MIEETIQLLGKRAKDKVSGFEGVISTVSFDLFGCVQCVLSPPAQENGKLEDSRWFDVQRLTVDSKKPVMDVPAFKAITREPATYSHGAADKPKQTNALACR